MERNHFKKLTERRFGICKDLMLGKKDVEYSRGDDKLHNFKRAGELSNTSPEMALRGMLTKHVISIYDIIDDIEAGRSVKPEVVSEKITDVINYHVLLEGLIMERLGVSFK